MTFAPISGSRLGLDVIWRPKVHLSSLDLNQNSGSISVFTLNQRLDALSTVGVANEFESESKKTDISSISTFAELSMRSDFASN